jgi:hypothetical protein
LPLSQFGSSNQSAGMMQRWPRAQGCLNEAAVAAVSKRELLVL